MVEYRLFRYLKQADLHAITALESVQRSLGLASVRSLSRYDLFSFKSDDFKCEQVPFFLDLLGYSYEFVNPTKHGYVLSALPAKFAQARKDTFLLKTGVFHHDSMYHCSNRMKNKLESITVFHYLLWEIGIDLDGQSPDVVQKDLQKRLVYSTSRREGLLVNPLFEWAEWCDKGDYYG